MGRCMMLWKGETHTAPEGAPTLGSVAVGSSVYLNVNGAPTEFIVVHQGKPSALYDDSCDGVWLLMRDCYEERAWHSSAVNDYEKSDIHTYLNSDFLGLFDADIQVAIKDVKIPYQKGTGASGSVASGANGLLAKIFLLSAYELGWTVSDNSSFPIDGSKMDYFLSGRTTDANNLRRAYFAGEPASWWSRSPLAGTASNNTTSTRAWLVSVGGGNDVNGVCTYSEGIRPALILPPAVLVRADGTITV